MKLKPVLAVCAAVMIASSAFATSYTWNASVSSGNWDDAANWLVDGAATTGFPSSSSDVAVFAEGTTATVTRTTAQSIAKLNLSAANVKLTLTQGAASLNASALTVAALAISGENLDFTLDGVSVIANNKPMMGSAGKLSILNGSYFYSNVFYNQAYNETAKTMAGNEKGGSIYVAGGSMATMEGIHLQNGLLEIDDSTFSSNWGLRFWNDTSATTIRFKGQHPLLKMTSGSAQAYANASGYNVHFEFVIPEGGFSETPLQSGNSIYTFPSKDTNTGFSGVYAIDVADDSPAKIAGETLTARLISWTIYSDKITSVNLPQSTDSYVWGASSLDVTLSGTFIVVTPNIEDKAWKGFDLSIAASESVRELYVAYGATDGGTDASKWTTAKLADLAASATTYSYLFSQTADATWGADDFKVIRFYFVEDGVKCWSKATESADAPEFSAMDASVDRRTITVSGQLSFLGTDNEAEVTLWVGETNDENALVQTGVAKTVTDTEPFTLDPIALDGFGKTYYYQLRAAGTSARTTIGSFTTSDGAVTYEWTGNARDGDWTNKENWANDKDGDCVGYPSVATSTAKFGAGTTVEFALAKDATVGTLDFSSGGATVMFKKAAGVATSPMLTIATLLDLSGKDNAFTLDGTRLLVSSGQDVTLGSNSTWKVVNDGARVALTPALSADAVYFYNRGGKVCVENGASFACQRYYMHDAAHLLVKDATFAASHRTVWNSTDAANPDVIRLEGSNTVYKMTYPQWHFFCAGTSGAVLNLDFVVPKTGFTAAPLRAIYETGASTIVTYAIGEKPDIAQAGVMNVNLIQEATLKAVTTPLISWPDAGISRKIVKEGAKPRSAAKFLWKDSSGAVTTADYPVALDAELPGGAGMMLIIR